MRATPTYRAPSDLPRSALATVAALASLSLPACTTTAPTAPESCEALGVRVEAATPADRYLLGRGAAYEGDPATASRADVLRGSQRARRELGWQVALRVLSPTTLPTGTGLPETTTPAFRTWYDIEDLRRLFHHAYEGIGAERRATRDAFDDTELDETFGWNVTAVDALGTWTPDRWATYLASLDDAAALGGVGGVRRIGLSPGAARHAVASYAGVIDCMQNGAPPAFVASGDVTQRLVRESVALGRCEVRTFGPYYVTEGGRLEATLEGDADELGDASLTVLRATATTSEPSSEVLCTASGATPCDVAGPAVVFVQAASGARGLDAMVDVELHTAAPAPGCLVGPFPLDAATIAAHWQRGDGLTMPSYDTSAAALRRHLEGDATWGSGDAQVDPGPEAIYTVRTDVGSTFRLAAMHIRARELDHWVNVTLWWSPEPDTDFGADRPAAFASLGAPFDHYKMCVSLSFEERDPDASGGFATDAPTLGAALREVYEGVGGPTWCSNPYIDASPGLARGNCVGCHQHALSGVRPGAIATDEAHYPHSGRTAMRNNEPSDGCWGFDAGDTLGSAFLETVTYWDANDGR